LNRLLLFGDAPYCASLFRTLFVYSASLIYSATLAQLLVSVLEVSPRIALFTIQTLAGAMNYYILQLCLNKPSDVPTTPNLHFKVKRWPGFGHASENFDGMPIDNPVSVKATGLRVDKGTSCVNLTERRNEDLGTQNGSSTEGNRDLASDSGYWI